MLKLPQWVRESGFFSIIIDKSFDVSVSQILRFTLGTKRNLWMLKLPSWIRQLASANLKSIRKEVLPRA